MKTVIVRSKNVYGTDRIYPVNDAADAFTKLTGTVTLSLDHIELIKSLGYTVEIEQKSL